ncbi:MAG: hypothetical protein EOM24_00635 [Chloroflexia bacterium]|nr:hypothetical protein [Chloroflexia bacterium]
MMSFKAFLRDYAAINSRFEFSAQKLEDLRSDLAKVMESSPYSDKITLVTMGSYGRKEASDESDIDCYLLFDSDKPVDQIADELAKIEEVVGRHIEQDPGDTGTFGANQILSFTKLSNNISGNNERAIDMTRRILLLLEGDWLYGDTRYRTYREELLLRYLKDHHKDHSLPRFLLNDIIRYYRTITTDFEYKTTTAKKGWGLRALKLRYSRPLLYFGGVVAAAETADVKANTAIDRLLEILELPILQRIYELNPATPETAKLFEQYDFFLETVSDPEKRQELSTLKRENRKESKIYTEINHQSRAFTQALADWLRAKYSGDHAIHHALIF